MRLRSAGLVASVCVLLASGCSLAHETCDAASCGAAMADVGARDAGRSAHDAFVLVTDAGPALDAWQAPDVGSDASHDASPDVGTDAGPRDLPPRQIAPLSTATVTTRRPTLRWSLPAGVDGAHIDLCADRACTMILDSADVASDRYRPMSDLPGSTVVFWRLFARMGDAVGEVASPTWQFIVPSRSAPIDSSWGTTLDVDGDGYTDVLVGAPHAQEFHLYSGSAAGLSPTPATFGARDPSGFPSGFGGALASAGDVNGDGFADVVVGAHYNASVLVYFGSAAGIDESAAVILHDRTYASALGGSVASAGDVNGDGYADIIVGGSPGAAFVYLGRASGIATTPQTPVGDAYAVAGVGDVNADGFGDVVVSGAMSDVAGAVHILLGSASGLARSFPIDPSSFMYSGFGTNVAGAGDTNGDGYADFVVSAPTSPGHVLVYMGNATGPFTTATTELAATGYTELGSWLAGGCDFDGDGYSDLAASTFDEGATKGAFVYRGGPMGLGTTPAIRLALGSPRIGGAAVLAAADVDGDGRADLVATVQTSLVDSVVQVFSGVSGGVAAMPALVLMSPDGSGTSYGAALAMREWPARWWRWRHG